MQEANKGGGGKGKRKADKGGDRECKKQIKGQGRIAGMREADKGGGSK